MLLFFTDETVPTFYDITRLNWAETLVFNAVEGGKAHIDLSFKNFEKPVVEWYKGKDKIESTGRHEFSFDEKYGTYSLTINNVNLNDAGIYKCIVFTEGREIPIRCDLRIKEKEFRPRFVEDLDQEPIIFKKGRQIIKSFTILGSPPPFVTWYKNDVPLFDTKRIDIRSRDDSYHLSIREARAEDSGTYKCEASNPHGTAFRTFDFKVEGKQINMIDSLDRLKYVHRNRKYLYFFFSFNFFSFLIMLFSFLLLSARNRNPHLC